MVEVGLEPLISLSGVSALPLGIALPGNQTVRIPEDRLSHDAAHIRLLYLLTCLVNMTDPLSLLNSEETRSKKLRIQRSLAFWEGLKKKNFLLFFCCIL